MLFRLTREQAQETHSLYCYSVNRTKAINFFGMKICRNLLLHFGKNLTKKALGKCQCIFLVKKSIFLRDKWTRFSLFFANLLYILRATIECTLKENPPFNDWTHGMEAHWHGQRWETGYGAEPEFLNLLNFKEPRNRFPAWQNRFLVIDSWTLLTVYKFGNSTGSRIKF